MKWLLSLPVTIATYILLDIIARPLLWYFFTRPTRHDLQSEALWIWNNISQIELMTQLWIVPCIVVLLSVYLWSRMLDKKRFLYTLIVWSLASLYTIFYTTTYITETMWDSIDWISQLWFLVIISAPILWTWYIAYSYYTQGNNFELLKNS